MQKKLVGLIALIVILSTWGYIAFIHVATLQVGIANGTYYNRCCGDVVLNNGTMTIGEQKFGYDVKEDRSGAYIVPSTVMILDKACSCLITDSESSEEYWPKLRLDDPEHPHQIKILQNGGPAFYTFLRKDGS